ncbi:MAG: hypothetical protein K0S09_1306 [Sphingobacteriaceae bacterium]|jgi:hypothetical protein|nr:hypothetical protein [Sphingobacteriaceae bacterium]
MKKYLILILLMPVSVIAQQKINTRFLEKLLRKHKDLFGTILSDPNHKEVQVLYTQIDRDENNIPHFKSYSYRMDPTWYFYPASTVKLPGVIFALEKINRLNIPGFTKESTMITDSAFKGQTKVSKDESAKNGLPSIEHYIKKVLLTSDNDAYNRLYEFVGRAELNQKLLANGITKSRFLNRLAIGDAGEQARHTNPISFYNGDKLVYRQEAQYDANDYPLELKNLIRGVGYMDANDKLVNEPYSFVDKNVYTIADQQLILKKLLFPEAFPEAERFNLTPDDYKLIYTYMSMLPTESDYPKYDPKEFWPTYAKMIYYGRDKNEAISPDIRIFNKYGDSYGYIIDNAYFTDLKNNVEFMLTAVVQSNDDGIYNDNKYEYETVCYPFMKNLGQVIYDLELKRKKQHEPDLSKFKVH